MPVNLESCRYLEKSTDYLCQLYTVTDRIVDLKTSFQHMEILDIPQLGRTLFLDGELQSAQVDEFIYHESLVHPGMLLCEKAERVLIIGGGEGATLREVSRYREAQEIVMVDIDREMVDHCRRHLPEWSSGAFDDSRVRVEYADAFSMLQRDTGAYDVILVDLTEPHDSSPSRKLFTMDFFRFLKSKLRCGGTLALQASRTDFHLFRRHAEIYSVVRRLFRYTDSYQIYLPSFCCTWGFLTASDGRGWSRFNGDEIDHLLSERVSGELKFYDGITHQRMFALPKIHRNLLRRVERKLDM